MNYKQSQGAVLIVVLVICLLVGLIAKSTIEIGMLQLKMVQNFRAHHEVKQIIEKELIKIEQQLARGEKSAKATFLQFVPDTLAYNETQGTLFYRIEVNKQQNHEASIHLASTFSVRQTQEVDNTTELSTDTLVMLRDKLKAQRIIDAKIITLHSGRSVIVTAYISTINKLTEIALIESYSNIIIRTFLLPNTISSKLLPVDSQNKGYANAIYMGSNNALLKLDLSSSIEELWEIKQLAEDFSANIVGKLLIGRHPSNQGFVLYLLAENNILFAYEEMANEAKPLFSIKALSQPLLYQGYLITTISDTQLGVFDAFTGKAEAAYPLQIITEFGVPQEEYIYPRVIITQPLDKHPIVVVNTAFYEKQAVASVLAKRLGRRTWRIL